MCLPSSEDKRFIDLAFILKWQIVMLVIRDAVSSFLGLELTNQSGSQSILGLNQVPAILWFAYKVTALQKL